MPDSSSGAGTPPPYPKWSDRLIRQLDAFAAARSKAPDVPALLLARQDGGDPRSPAFLVREYEHRLTRARGGGGRQDGHGGAHFQVPHAVVDDAELSGGFVEAVDHVALRFQLTMPSGRLRLPAFHTCRKVLEEGRGTGDARAQQQPLLDALHEALLERRGALRSGVRAADFLGRHFLTGWLQGVVAALIVGLPKALYGHRLRHRGLRWVADDLGAACFLDAALAFCQDGVLDREDPRVRRVLLRALLTDLYQATRRRTWLSHLWARRRWSFVVLIPEIDDPDGPGRAFLSTFEELAGEHSSQPLLVLAACAGSPPDYAVPLGAVPNRPNGVADKVFACLNEGSEEPVRLVTLPADDDAEGTARTKIETSPGVVPRRDRPLDWLRPAVLPAVAVAAAGALVAPHLLWPDPPPRPPSCVTVETGERVGVTDGSSCDLAVPGERGEELRSLERQVAAENAHITDRRYRTLVFLAPLSLQNGVYDDPPTGLQILRGAILQQHRLNAGVRQNKMPVRLLIANAGQYFKYGARDAGDPKAPDVARMIVDRQSQERVAAVIGLTQSRPESLGAARELDAAGIPVIANGVSGSDMVGPDSPQRYFQISAPNGRIAPVMADFLRRSPEVHALTSPTPHAVVVYDPTDAYFSTDLKNLFVGAYRRYGGVGLVKYSEKPGATTPDSIATDVCDKVAANHGVIVYLGRSGVLPSLLNAMQSAGGHCQPPEGSTIPLIAESAPIDFQLKARETAQTYPYMTLFYETTNAPTSDPRDPYAQFARDFATVFGSRGADADAAAGFDAVGIVSQVVEDLLPASPDVKPNDIYLWLTAHGVSQYPGASGVLRLDGQHNYPPDKAVFVREIRQPEGTTATLMSCGILPNRQDPAVWGTPPDTFPCPRDPGAG
ncbi:ABC transporter substrate-binding protein [Streptomyces sp. NPDC046985]|uniref:ABC transporter substrate-binding protein n=1 Tax=Streptomyces sp. NPDC046985 TaxID=3155377 RepID=UPI0033F8BFA5